jgi:hypothetical protein
MVNPFADVNWKPDLAGKRKFAVSLIFGFPCIALLMFLVRGLAGGHWRPGGLVWLAVAGSAAGMILWALPMIARPFYVVWYFIGCCMGFVMGNLLLSVFFYLVVTPIGWLMRIAGKISLARGFDKSKPTYWQEGEKVVDLRDYYRQF